MQLSYYWVSQTTVQWLSSDNYIFELVFFSKGGGGVQIPEFFFSFSYSFSGQFELPSVVTNSDGPRRGLE